MSRFNRGIRRLWNSWNRAYPRIIGRNSYRRNRSNFRLLVREQLEGRLPLAGDIAGTLWHDANGDGIYQEGIESALSNWTVYLDQNKNRQLDEGETNTVSNGSGQYSFSGLPADTYFVSQMAQSGFRQTSPALPQSPLGLPSESDPNGQNVVKLSQLTIASFNNFDAITANDSARAADISVYVSPSGKEYALIGLERGTGIVDVTNPRIPVIVAVVPGGEEPGGLGSQVASQTSPETNATMSSDSPPKAHHEEEEGEASIWREIAVFGQFAYTVTEGGGGIQVIDLTGVDNGVVEVANAGVTIGPNRSHTIRVNPQSGFLYVMGSSSFGGATGGGLQVFSLANPAQPTFAGHWSGHYVHDSVTVSYTSGPFAGKEVCFAFATHHGVMILDVTDKSNIQVMSDLVYPNVTYAHYGQLSEDRQFLFINDELDEINDPDVNTSTTYVANIADLYNPSYLTSFSNGRTSVDHNLSVRGNYLFEANYTSGLRIFDITDPVNAVEVGSFDTFPDNDSQTFNGAWGVEAILPSGVVVVSDIQGGLFVFDPSESVGPFGWHKVTLADGEVASARDFASAQLPVLDPIGNQILSGTGPVNRSLTATDLDTPASSLVFTATAQSIAYQLDTQYNLNLSGSDSYNYGGQQEKWVQSGTSGPWFFILPNGELHQWNNVPNSATGPLVGTPGEHYYTNLSQLYNASSTAPATVSVQGSGSPSTLVIDPNQGFVGNFLITVDVSDGSNVDSETFNVRVNVGGGGSQGEPPVLDAMGNQTLSGTGSANRSLTATDSDTSASSLVFTATAQSIAYQLDTQYNLNLSGSDSYNYGGQQEKWVRSGTSGPWFFILPNGELHQWNNVPNSATGPLVGTPGEHYYTNLSQLYNASSTAPATVSVQGSGSPSTLVIDPNQGFVGNFLITVDVSDGSNVDSETFNVRVNEGGGGSQGEPPVLDAIGNQTLSGTGSANRSLAATDSDTPATSLVFTATAQSIAYQLDTQYNLILSGSDSYNDGGQQEKWVRSGTSGPWFFILPNGELHQWNNVPNSATGPLVGTPGEHYYTNLSQLYNASSVPPATVSVQGSGSPSSLVIDPNEGFVGNFLITVDVSDGSNVDSETFNVRVNAGGGGSQGAPPVLDAIGNQTLSGTSSVNRSLTATDSDTPATSLVFTATAQSIAYQLDTQYNLNLSGSDSYNYGGQQEKWVQSGTSGPWFFILPNGELHQWNNAPNSATGPLVGTPGEYYYTNLSQLYNASSTAPATVSVQGSGSPSTLEIDPNEGFVGNFLITVNVSDGSNVDSETFNVQVNLAGGQSPSLAPIGTQNVLGSAGSNVGVISAADADTPQDSLVYSANATSYAFELDQQLDLHTDNGNLWFDRFGGEEKWLLGDNGQSYFVLPNGVLHRWNGIDGQLAGPILGKPGPYYYTNISELYSATEIAPGTASVQILNGQPHLILDPIDGFEGEYLATVTVSDGSNVDFEKFNVHVTSSSNVLILPVYSDSAGEGFNDPFVGSARRNALTYALNIWSDLLTAAYSGETIRVQIEFNPLGANVIGQAGSVFVNSDFGGAAQANTWYGDALANHLAGRDLHPNSPEIAAEFSSNFNFYLGTDGVGSGIDFVTVALHEIGHGLNFFSLVQPSGAWALANRPGIYDRLLEAGDGTDFVTMSQAQRASAVIGNDLHWSGLAGTSGGGGIRPRIHAPSVYQGGSSISHLSEATLGFEIMSPVYSFADHLPSARELGMLSDMGWSGFSEIGGGGGSLTGNYSTFQFEKFETDHHALSQGESTLHALFSRIGQFGFRTFADNESLPRHDDHAPVPAAWECDLPESQVGLLIEPGIGKNADSTRNSSGRTAKCPSGNHFDLVVRSHSDPLGREFEELIEQLSVDHLGQKGM